MDVGSINSKNITNNIQTDRTKSADDDFERKLREAAEKGDDAQLKEVCHEFEGIFLNMMYKQMKATVPKSEYLESDSATEMFNSMLDEKLCDAASQKGIGIADVMYKQMSKQYLKHTDSAEAAGGAVDEKK